MKLKNRLDLILVEKQIFETREKAKRSIMSGQIFVNNKRVDKAGTLIPYDSEIEIKGKTNPFVSRGGLKLQKALSFFNIDVRNKIAIDVGASTGGFTDCLVKNGAKKIYAIDVGYGQLAYTLRKNPHVINLEKTNIRYVPNDKINDFCDIATIDVSFISLKKVIPEVTKFMKDNFIILPLIKPQFEAKRENVGKKGVVKNKSLHSEIILGIVKFLSNIEINVTGITYSPIKGPKGNIEYLIFCKNNKEALIDSSSVLKCVEEAYINLN